MIVTLPANYSVQVVRTHFVSHKLGLHNLHIRQNTIRKARSPSTFWNKTRRYELAEKNMYFVANVYIKCAQLQTKRSPKNVIFPEM